MKSINLMKFALLLLTAFSVCVSGQEEKAAVKEKQVLLSVSVYGYPGERELVKNLKQEKFLVYENNKSVETSYFTDENSPISAGILIDVSRSMARNADFFREGILMFLEKSNPKNEYFVAAFSSKVDLLSDFANTDETVKIVSDSPYFGEKRKRGETLLPDALKLGVEKLSKAKNQRKVLFVLWNDDGNYPSANFKELEKLFRENNITLYPFGCCSNLKSFAPATLLENMTEISGGKIIDLNNKKPAGYRSKVFPPDDYLLLKFLNLAEQLQNQYVIGFKPNPDAADSKWRKIKIEIKADKELKKQFSNIFTLHRTGYYPLSNVVTDN